MLPVLQQRGHALPGAAEAIAAIASATVGGAAIGFAVPGVSLPPGDGSSRGVPGARPAPVPASAHAPAPAEEFPIAIIPAPERLPDPVGVPAAGQGARHSQRAPAGRAAAR